MPCLTALDLSHNQLTGLQPLSRLIHLTYADLSYNSIAVCRQVEYLSSVPYLHSMGLKGNPCALKDLYRLRIIARLQWLRLLDSVEVGLEERVVAYNAYHSSEGDLALRQGVLSQYSPQLPFVDFSNNAFPGGVDDEAHLVLDEVNNSGGRKVQVETVEEEDNVEEKENSDHRVVEQTQ